MTSTSNFSRVSSALSKSKDSVSSISDTSDTSGSSGSFISVSDFSGSKFSFSTIPVISSSDVSDPGSSESKSSNSGISDSKISVSDVFSVCSSSETLISFSATKNKSSSSSENSGSNASSDILSVLSFSSGSGSSLSSVIRSASTITTSSGSSSITKRSSCSSGSPFKALSPSSSSALYTAESSADMLYEDISVISCDAPDSSFPDFISELSVSETADVSETVFSSTCADSNSPALLVTTSPRSFSLSIFSDKISCISLSTSSSSFLDIIPHNPWDLFLSFLFSSSVSSLLSSFLCSFLSLDLTHICLNFMELVTGASSSTMIMIFASLGCIFKSSSSRIFFSNSLISSCSGSSSFLSSQGKIYTFDSRDSVFSIRLSNVESLEEFLYFALNSIAAESNLSLLRI